MSDIPQEILTRIDALVDELFVNGMGREADRLVLTTKEGGDLGGWCKGAVRDRIQAAAREVVVGLLEALK